MPRIGVIAGSGLYEVEGLKTVGKETVKTPYGPPSGSYTITKTADGTEIVFLPRHGSPHEIPPHRVNYRANIFGFKELGAEVILSVSATGGINRDFAPGSLVLLDQIMDFTSGRESTFNDGPQVVHVDFTNPFCGRVRELILTAASRLNIEVQPHGTYVCTNGPRLESEAEIRMFSSLGADIVGMTAMPEAVLAREMEICYAGISVVTNPAAGISGRKLTTTEVVETMKNTAGELKRLIFSLIPDLAGDPRSCPCGEALKEAKL